jgi:23S rRNA G2445 N2-methylase RlmL
VALVEAVLTAPSPIPATWSFEPFCGSGTQLIVAAERTRAALLRGGTGPGLLRRGRAAVGDGDGATRRKAKVIREEFQILGPVI